MFKQRRQLSVYAAKRVSVPIAFSVGIGKNDGNLIGPPNKKPLPTDN
jgi:hypothetical protein